MSAVIVATSHDRLLDELLFQWAEKGVCGLTREDQAASDDSDLRFYYLDDDEKINGDKPSLAGVVSRLERFLLCHKPSKILIPATGGLDPFGRCKGRGDGFLSGFWIALDIQELMPDHPPIIIQIAPASYSFSGFRPIIDRVMKLLTNTTILAR